MTVRPLRPVLAAVAAAAAAVLPAACTADPGTPEAAPSPTPTVRVELAALTIAAPHSMSGYSREKFPHWITRYDDCDTRDVVLKRDGKNVVTDDHCEATSGTWLSPYDGKTLTDDSDVEIDHMVPLADAWRSGADEWDITKRRKFANDLKNPELLATSSHSNRAKGDQSPDHWKPSDTGYWCTYARAWVRVKYAYDLTVTSAEKTALGDMLGHCGDH